MLPYNMHKRCKYLDLCQNSLQLCMKWGKEWQKVEMIIRLFFVSFRDDFNVMFTVCFWNAVVWFGQAWLYSVKYVKCKKVE